MSGKVAGLVVRPRLTVLLAGHGGMASTRRAGESVEDGKVVFLGDERGIQIEVEVEALVGGDLVDAPGHEEVGGVVVALRFHEAAIEPGELGIVGLEGDGEALEFLAAPALDQCGAEEMIDDLMPAAGSDGAHEATDPGAGMGLIEGDAAPAEEVEDELEMLQFLDGDGIEFVDAIKEIAVFLEAEGAGGGLALEVGVIDQDRGELGADLGQPGGGRLGPEQQHGLGRDGTLGAGRYSDQAISQPGR